MGDFSDDLKDKEVDKAAEELVTSLQEGVKQAARDALERPNTPVAQPEPPKGFSLTQLINQRIADERQDKEYSSWRASAMGKCLREHYLKRLGVAPTSPPDERTERIFKVGDVFHNWIQDTVDSQGYATEIEKELFDEELDLGGRCDLIVGLVDVGKTYSAGNLPPTILYDIKTINSRAFWHLENSGKTVKEKYPQYWVQLGAYMLMLKRQGNPVDEGRIFLVSKDDLMTKEVSYHLDGELEERVLSELETLNNHWAEKTLPPCTCLDLYLDKNGKSSGPRYCSYKEPGSTTKCCSESLAKEKL